MKKKWIGILSIAAMCWASGSNDVRAQQWGELFKGLQKAVGGSEQLPKGRVVAGLKEALEIGTDHAVAAVGKAGGYSENPKIRIPMPGPVEKASGVLRALGFGPKLDAFDESMNRAAEKAAPAAKPIFQDAILGMTISDAQGILKGGDTAATDYFKEKTYGKLRKAFQPIVHDAMSQVGVTKQYQDLTGEVRNIPFAGDLSMDLDGYVTDGALEGLFYMVGQEEKRIRQDPAARATELLKQVFGGS